MKKIIIGIVVILLIVGGYFFFKSFSDSRVEVSDDSSKPEAQNNVGQTENKSITVIGKSVEGRDIISYHFGTGTSTELLFVGGIHGGYEWNTTLVAYQLMDYLKANPTKIPSNIRVSVIPVLNPDGLVKVVGTTSNFTLSQVSSSQEVQVSGRFNAHTVDLNRNFDCDWQANAEWQNKPVSGGDRAFSEPESLAFKNYIEGGKPTAVVVWYSSAGGVFASSCHNGVLPETNTITKVFSDASKYPAHQNFDFYEITGDMVNWLAKNNIPAISVLLTNHTDTEWTKNQAGIEVLFKHYSE